jgi:peptide methionine sulfoxide reductase msrA/msrB
MADVKEIYLAGGCFWGLEMYMENVSGVVNTEVGYANGDTENPSYEDVCKGSGHAEVCRVVYDADVSGLLFIVQRLFDVIDPVSVNRQGGDSGVQYRTGVYYTNMVDKFVIQDALADLQKYYKEPVAVECKPLENYYKAEEYHQKYLHKNPGGYCHISMQEIEDVKKYKDRKGGQPNSAQWHSGLRKRKEDCNSCDKRRR